MVINRSGVWALAAVVGGLVLAGCDEPAVAPLPPVQRIIIDPNPDTLAAPWNLAGPVETAAGRGDTILTDIPAGIYRLTWQPVADWELPRPASIETTVVEGATVNFSGTYTAIATPAEFVFVRVPAGTFTMGSPLGELGSSDTERPQHDVTVDAFLMSTSEVTQKQWFFLRGTDPSWFTGCDDCPVERVSWLDAILFCNALSDADGLQRAYSQIGPAITWDTAADGYRLPTEAEWEYACRAGAATALANGDLTVTGCDIDPNLSSGGWYCGNAADGVSEVAQKEANAFGLYDMHGNVWEWVWDWYGDYSAAPADNPTGPAIGSFKVMRSGSWLYGAQRCRSASRRLVSAGSKSSDLGFRIVRNDTVSTKSPQDAALSGNHSPLTSQASRRAGGQP